MELLDQAILAHGGLERWRSLANISAQVEVGGGLWHLKGWPDVFARADIRLDPHAQRIEYAAFLQPGQRTRFEPGSVAVVSNDGHIVAQRTSPRSAFAGHSITTKWDELHVIYFSGYAMWNYLTAPFTFKLPDMETREVDPWNEAGEKWRRLWVKFPENFHYHSREQTFYFDDTGLLRRHDYSVEILGGTNSAHYVSEHKDFGGIVFPTKRRVYAIDPGNHPIRDRVAVSIDLLNVALS